MVAIDASVGWLVFIFMCEDFTDVLMLWFKINTALQGTFSFHCLWCLMTYKLNIAPGKKQAEFKKTFDRCLQLPSTLPLLLHSSYICTYLAMHAHFIWVEYGDWQTRISQRVIIDTWGVTCYHQFITTLHYMDL